MIFSLTSAVILAIVLHNVQSNSVVSPNNVSDVDTTLAPSEGELSNNTLNAFQTTEYAIVDFAKLGYEMFKEKLFSALLTLDSFMEMKPAIIKITRTFIFGNESDLSNTTNSTISEINNKTGDLLNEQSQVDITKPLETNTESPPKNDLQAELSDSRVVETELPVTNKYSAPFEANKISHRTDFLKSQDQENQIIHTSTEFKGYNDHIHNDDSEITKTKVENEGFFGQVFSSVGHFFKNIWNWFTG